MYGFDSQKSQTFPKMVVVSLTNFCDYRCKHCYYPKYCENPATKPVSLQTTIFGRICQELSCHPESVLRLIAWGEPLLHPKIRELSVLAQEVAPQNLKSLITHGYHLDPDLSCFLMQNGLGLVEVSLDAASNDYYSKVRSSPYENAFEIVTENVLCMIADRNQNHFSTRIALSFILYDDTESAAEFERFKELWQSKVDEVICRPAHSFMGSIQNVKPMPLKRPPCYCLWARCNVSPEGKISVCYNDWQNQDVLGDLADKGTTIAEIWQSEIFDHLRQAQIQGDFRGICEHCKDYNPNAWQMPYEDIIDRTKAAQ